MEPIGDPGLDTDEYEEELDAYEAAAEAGHNEDFDEPGPDADADEEV
jgi:hypothetical protein